jgi:hypothetical protein
MGAGSKATKKVVADSDDALLAQAAKAAAVERARLKDAAAHEAKQARLAEERARKQAERERAAASIVRAEDKAAVAEMPAMVIPRALAAEPTLLRMLQRTDPAASTKGERGVSATKDYSKETPRERELRVREARARFKVMRQAMEQRRGGKKVLERAKYKEPPVFYGDETADEIATRPQLIQEYMKRYAEWLVQGMLDTKLLDNEATCPDHFALLFRFDTTLDPVCRNPKSKLGSQVDMLIVCYQRVLYFVWSDYADGLLKAAINKDATGRPLLDVVMAPYNVVQVLSGGKRPTGLGTRITELEELAKMPYLNAEFYPHGIPAELVLKKRAWGSDLGDESSAEKLARALARDDADALDSDSDDEATKTRDADDVTQEIRKEVRALGRTRFPLSQAILDAFKPNAESVQQVHANEDADELEDAEDDGEVDFE